MSSVGNNHAFYRSLKQGVIPSHIHQFIIDIEQESLADTVLYGKITL